MSLHSIQYLIQYISIQYYVVFEERKKRKNQKKGPMLAHKSAGIVQNTAFWSLSRLVDHSVPYQWIKPME